MEIEQGETRRVRRAKGGMITMPFIFANELCEKLAVVGFTTNMINYLTNQLHMPLAKAASTLNNFDGTACFTPLIGAFISDAYAGCYWTIAIASIIYLIGMICLTLSATIPTLRPPQCKGEDVCEAANSWQLAILYSCLLLTAIGSGGIRPCVSAFGADQLDERDPKKSTAISKFFNWYYLLMGASKVVAVTVVVYVQDNIGWGWGLGVPTALMALSVIAFMIGHPLYHITNSEGSPFTRLVQVCVAAYRKRNLPMVSQPTSLYENQELDAPISLAGKLLHTEHMMFLDKAAIVTPEDTIESSSAPNLWRLNTVHRVEELKSLIRMGPIWAAGIFLFLAFSQQGTFCLQQAKTMDRHLRESFEIPAGSMSVFSITSMMLTVVLYDRILVPITRRFTGADRGITFLTRMGIGFVISILGTCVSGFVEIKRKQVAADSGLTDKPHSIIPIPVFWLAPQYCLQGIAEGFASIGYMDFFYNQAPESLKSTATALFWVAVSLGDYTSSLLVSMIHKFSKKPDGSNWLPNDNLNKGKLEYFYWLITLLQALNLVYYIFCAKFYTFKPIQVRSTEDAREIEARTQEAREFEEVRAHEAGEIELRTQEAQAIPEVTGETGAGIDSVTSCDEDRQVLEICSEHMETEIREEAGEIEVWRPTTEVTIGTSTDTESACRLSRDQETK